MINQTEFNTIMGILKTGQATDSINGKKRQLDTLAALNKKIDELAEHNDALMDMMRYLIARYEQFAEQNDGLSNLVRQLVYLVESK